VDVRTGAGRNGNGKSPFLAAILSVVPGVGHLYLGYIVKGVTIMAVTAGGFVMMVVAPFVTHYEARPEALVSAVLYVLVVGPVCFFYAVFDAYHLARAGRAGAAGGRVAGVAPAGGGAALEPASDAGAAVVGPRGGGEPAAETRSTSTWGGILTGIGLISLIWTHGGKAWHTIFRLWPVLIIAVGVYLAIGYFREWNGSGAGGPGASGPGASGPGPSGRDSRGGENAK
jgi:hypothetical protein